MKRRKIFIGGLHKETSFGKPKTFMDFLFFVFCFLFLGEVFNCKKFSFKVGSIFIMLVLSTSLYLFTCVEV